MGKYYYEPKIRIESKQSVTIREKLKRHPKQYSTTEKESIALICSLQHFEIYAAIAHPYAVISTDHNPLVSLVKVKNKNRRLLVWSLALQEFNFEIKPISGIENKWAVALSRI